MKPEGFLIEELQRNISDLKSEFKAALEQIDPELVIPGEVSIRIDIGFGEGGDAWGVGWTNKYSKGELTVDRTTITKNPGSEDLIVSDIVELKDNGFSYLQTIQSVIDSGPVLGFTAYNIGEVRYRNNFLAFQKAQELLKRFKSLRKENIIFVDYNEDDEDIEMKDYYSD